MLSQFQQSKCTHSQPFKITDQTLTTAPNSEQWSDLNTKRFLLYVAFALGGSPAADFAAIAEKMGPTYTTGSLSGESEGQSKPKRGHKRKADSVSPVVTPEKKIKKDDEGSEDGEIKEEAQDEEKLLLEEEV